MAPSKQPQPPFSKDERVLCFHGEMLYEAKILDVQPSDNGEGFQYKIHYKGWKSSWDDWVFQDRVRKFSEENKDLASQLLNQFRNLQSGKTTKGLKKALRANGSDLGSARGSEERTAAATTQSGRGPRRARDFDLEHDAFHSRPSIKLPMPDHLKAMLVDDWENVTKNQQLVPLPHPHPVDQIFDDYLNYERHNRIPGSASVEILEEIIAGLREYFDKCLGRILLYRFERAQFHELHQQWNSGTDSEHRSPCDTYGAEHLSRLLVSLPELVAQTNMDQQSVNRLREELMKFTRWFGNNTVKYFVNEYETPSQEYVDQARNA
ncbi:MRG-domain-containing protein [Lasiosphaeria miniovina]|uniref:Chromatin modification-related protein EAF3 n=1 Tax=Lasiosphaeria miniovina TaxID=1954250 RepID=A0AA39ZZR4_9PEZI|nr:MRG-domain-containing protein [Lasiosphaeria miniovina]KAK0706374.1 MRG-domain-containing protein [Lasiosphaeria miniovina]